MSSDKCEKCGLSLDLCVCKQEAEDIIREGLTNGTLVRCSKCGNPFSPDSFSDTLCGDCRGEPVGDEPIEQDSETEDDVEGDRAGFSQEAEATDPDKKMPESEPAPVPAMGTSVLDQEPVLKETFSAIPVITPPEEQKVEVLVPQKVTVTVNANAGAKANEDAQLVDYYKNPATNEVILKGMNDDTGKPIIMTMSDGFIQQLIRKLLPDEKQRQQDLLDRMHNIRKTRGLSVENIDKMLTKLMDEAEQKFNACKTGTDVKKVEAMFRAKLAVLTQKRYLAKFSIQEESELSLQLAKLQHGED